MYGAIIGDIVGSKYEFHPIKTKDFPLVSEGCGYTDDTLMTIAVAQAILEAREGHNQGDTAFFKDVLVGKIQEFGCRFPYAGYGGMFSSWLFSDDPQPYNSFGNGSAMRVSPCGLIAATLDEALALAKASAEVTHNHPEGIKGAQAVAACVFLARRSGNTKEKIGEYVRENFYELPASLDEIRLDYGFDETCQGSVPQAIACFLESTSFEDAIRNAVSLGGDADTQAAIAGSIAWSYYRYGHGFEENADREVESDRACKWTQSCEDMVSGYHIDGFLPSEFVELIEEFDMQCAQPYL